ncbi:hypothetical protein F5B22DRAFT_662695 [Xylaria bambusicola]|uniref:uncharacterized protein n=1 Tax=Xylaria bambusicola TaxID=326684 RepID=UPI0020081459|nr:uncharacterized protein F5B22DRAFT_662695 [Xylaria bambusicola]KAI0503034.1 hypothetical protein F5B22DRAFT_662695 [Xylaria bambusicola]
MNDENKRGKPLDTVEALKDFPENKVPVRAPFRPTDRAKLPMPDVEYQYYMDHPYMKRLMAAIEINKFNRFQMLLLCWRDLPNHSLPHGPPEYPMATVEPCLYRAIEYNSREIVALLLDQGVKMCDLVVDEAVEHGCPTAMLAACLDSNRQLAKVTRMNAGERSIPWDRGECSSAREHPTYKLLDQQLDYIRRYAPYPDQPDQYVAPFLEHGINTKGDEVLWSLYLIFEDEVDRQEVIPWYYKHNRNPSAQAVVELLYKVNYGNDGNVGVDRFLLAQDRRYWIWAASVCRYLLEYDIGLRGGSTKPPLWYKHMDWRLIAIELAQARQRRMGSVANAEVHTETLRWVARSREMRPSMYVKFGHPDGRPPRPWPTGNNDQQLSSSRLNNGGQTQAATDNDWV